MAGLQGPSLQGPGRQNDPGDFAGIASMIRAMSDRISELERGASLRTAGISVAPTGMTIASALTVGGTLATTGATTIGGTLGVTGTTTLGAPTTVSGTLGVTGVTTLGAATTVSGSLNVTGPMTVGGTLSLPAGIIDNAALASPVTADQASVSQTNYATALTAQDFAVGSIPVPAGFSRALVMVVSTAGAINSAASSDFLYVSAGINAVSSREVFAAAGPGASASISTAKSQLLTDLSGGTINVRTIIHTQGNAWAANASNRAYTEAIAVFLR